MRGPFLLRPLQVDISVPSRVGGVYCVAKNSRQVAYVGRAESNLRDAIKAHWPEFQFFWYEPALSARECFVTQCRHYHRHCQESDFGNGDHPTPPGGLDEKCPVCGK